MKSHKAIDTLQSHSCGKMFMHFLEDLSYFHEKHAKVKFIFRQTTCYEFIYQDIDTLLIIDDQQSLNY